MCVYQRICMLNAGSKPQLIERVVEIHIQLYTHLCMHKIPHSFDHCDCFVLRLYAKLLSTHGPNLAYCAIFLNKLVNLYVNPSVLKYITLMNSTKAKILRNLATYITKVFKLRDSLINDTR